MYVFMLMRSATEDWSICAARLHAGGTKSAEDAVGQDHATCPAQDCRRRPRPRRRQHNGR